MDRFEVYRYTVITYLISIYIPVWIDLKHLARIIYENNYEFTFQYG